jgi:hypothetical protein
MTAEEWSSKHKADSDFDEVEITEQNALVVIAMELRSIKRTLHTMAFDPNCETVLDKSVSRVADALYAYEDGGSGLAEIIAAASDIKIVEK